LALRALVSIALLAYLLRRLDMDRWLEIVGLARFNLILPLVGLLLAERLFAAYRWWVLLRYTGVPISLPALVRINFVSTFLGIFLPTAVGVEFFKVYGLARQTSDLGLSLSSVLMDRIIGLTSLLLLVLVGAGLAPEEVRSAVAPWAWATLGGLAIGSAALLSRRVRQRYHNLLPGALVGSVKERVRNVYACMDVLRAQPWMIVWPVVLALGFQLLRVAIAIVAAMTLQLEISALHLFAFVPIINFIGLLPISLGGLGVRETGFVLFLGTVGVSPEAGLTLSLLIFLAAITSALPGAWLYVRGGHRAS
jgi:uncharacterized protein (TIRG00374 family)